MRYLNAIRLSFALCPWVVSCTGVTQLSGEAPYASMVGQCFELQKDMRVRENVCWELGGLILSPDEGQDCLRKSLGTVDSGTRVTVRDVRRQRWGSAGYCPQVIVDVDGVPVAGQEIYLPLCYSSSRISWLADPLWRRGDELRLKAEYAIPCDPANRAEEKTGGN